MKKLRINFNKNCKMHLACSDDDLLPVMQYIYFKGGYAYASDAHILIKNKISEITQLVKEDQLNILDGKYLHKSSFQKILTYDTIRITETGIECITGYSTIEFKFSTDESLKYPSAELVIAQIKKENSSLSRISLNANLYYKLYQSLYSDGKLVLRFSKSECHGILVKSQDKTIKSEAVIMPMLILE